MCGLARVTCVACHRKDYDATKSPAHAAAGFPVTCDSCHSAERFDVAEQRRRRLQPQRDLSAGRRPRDADLRDVPQEQRLQGHAARLRRLSPDRLQPDAEPESRGGRLPDDVRQLSSADRPAVEGRRRSTTTSSSRWSACTRRRRARRATRTTSTRARRATASAAIRRTTTAPQNPNHVDGGLPDDVRQLPSADRPAVDGRRRSTTTQFFALRRRARVAGVRDVPQEQRLQGHAARLRRLSSGRLQPRAEPEPRRRRASRRRATAVTGRPTRSGRARASTTTRSSRWSGVHATQACATCHKNNVYKGTPRDCVGCHQPNYNATRNPNHAGGRLPDDVRHAATGRPIRRGARARFTTRRSR